MPPLLIFQVLAWTMANVWRIFVRFLPFSASAACLVYTLSACQAFWSSKLNGAWAPAFPEARTNFVIALVALPIWGLSMAFFTLAWVVVTRFWDFLRNRLRRKRSYEPLAVDLNDAQGGRRNRQGQGNHMDHAFSGAVRNAGWFVLWGGYLSIAFFGLYMLRTYELPIDHRFKRDVELANRVPKSEGYGTGEQIFVAAMFYNNGGVLPYWIKEVSKLIYYLGPDKVFVSIVESNSWDNSADLLEEFDRKLEGMGVSRRILTRDTSIERPVSMGSAPPRIKFLAAVRNLVMQPLVEHGGYTRVIFSNDVFIEAESIVELLYTKGGDYDMACGLDLAYWGLYDQWVIRDRLGRLASTLWPYFLEDTGFRAVMADEPAPVFTCWNGIIAVRADPFLPPNLRTGQLSTSPLSRPLAPTHPAYPRPLNLTPAETPPVQFRSSAEGECFSSESFLLPYDLRRQFDLNNIYVNPRVINSYSWEFYVWFKYITRHWAVKWWIERVENGNGVHLAKMILGDPAKVWQWDGGELVMSE
ncbi:cryptococcal mannosyltransferase 1-domain-containing protein [Mycena maculata]|uniref:Cryptococcal mannosyltransferase 1-domain-containing protein n=1 Tax=Mycena maculata TaxID=230809 RepID=A0AAD7ID82_9AGAR|nr:cryptococcal mannosyltransferase 1-domain-containing protein [Mycena maculata]